MTAAEQAAHAFTRPGQVAPDLPAPDKCMVCGEAEAAHWLPSEADLAEAERINRAMDAETGAIRPVLRTYAASCCGVVASYPSHQGFCDRRHAARIWNSPPAAAARAAHAEMRAFTACPPDEGDDGLETTYVVLCAALDAAMTDLLALLDSEAIG